MAELQKNEEGKLTEEQAQELFSKTGELLKAIVTRVSQLDGEQLLKIRETESSETNPELVEVINDCYQMVLDADLPQGFNDYLPELSSVVFRQVFIQVAKKSVDNERAVVSHYIGKPYHDISVKDIVTHIEKIESTPRTD